MMASDTPSNPELHGRSTISDIQNALLLAFLNEFRELEKPDDRDEPPLFVFRIAESVGIKVSKTVLKFCIDDLANNGLITVGDTFEYSSPDFFCHLTAKGYSRAEQIERQSDAVKTTGLVTSPDTPPQASTALTSTTFGFGPNRANFDNGNFHAPSVGQAPAADRYVSVKDNQPVQALRKTLNEIRDEYARDHNKGELQSLGQPDEVLTEIDGTLAQIDRGKLRLGQITDGLDPALRKMLPYISAYPGLCKLLKDALDLIQLVWNTAGKHL